jgi:hypothetical protein
VSAGAATDEEATEGRSALFQDTVTGPVKDRCALSTAMPPPTAAALPATAVLLKRATSLPAVTAMPPPTVAVELMTLLLLRLAVLLLM